MNKILGDAKNIRSLLGGTKFAIDYYQREYRWEKKQITELLNDLCEKFLENHAAGNERSAVENYSRYFLGSIIISEKEGRKFIIDGQQRLTSLTLLLIHIYGQIDDDEQKKEIANLIFSYRVGKRSFNLDVAERTACMDALFTGQPFEENGQPESVVNILSRYQDIEGQFPDELANETLPFFADWLIENVYLVEITAYTDADAYTIFETIDLPPIKRSTSRVSFLVQQPRRTHHEAETIQRSTDHRGAEGSRGRDQETGSLPQAWDHRADVLPVALQVRGPAGVRRYAAEAA